MICDFYSASLTYQENFLAKYYVELGHDVTIITSTIESIFDYVRGAYDSRRPVLTFHDGKAKVVRLPYRINFLNRVRAFSDLDEMLESEAPDLIYVHNVLPSLLEATRYQRRHPSTRLIVDSHADYSNSGKNWLSRKLLHGVVRRWLLTQALPYIERFYAITPATALFVHENYNIPREQIELLPLGADLGAAATAEGNEATGSLRTRYGIAGNDFVIFSGGKHSPVKLFELLIEAVKNVKGENTWLILIGDSSEENASYAGMLRTLANQHPRIVFTGWLGTTQLFEHLAMSDIAVFPAGQSILWQQAIGMAKPLVIAEPMAQAGGHQDVSYLNIYDNIVVTDEPQTSASWMTAMIEDLKNDPAKRERMAVGARRVAAEILDWKTIAVRTLQRR